MTSPASGPSPLKIGGIALVGVAVVAAVIGLVTLGTGGTGGGSSAAAPTETASAAPTVPGSASAAPDTGAVPLPSFTTTAPPAVTTVQAPVTEAPAVAGAGAGGGADAAPALPLRVYNNSTIQGLAADAAADFRRGGWTVTDTTGYPYGTIPTSTVYYRPGTDEQPSADRLAAEYGLKSEPRFQGIGDASPGLIVIVTKDYQRR